MTHRLALNETPYPPLPSVQEAMVRAVARSHRYPEFHPRRLGERIAAWCGVPSESLAVGSGSVGVALRLLRAVLRTGEAMAYPWPAFDGYPLLGRMAGAHCAPVPLLPDGRQDLPALAAAAGGQAGVVVVCNPHNPTGTLVSSADLAAFLKQVPRKVIVVLDEAYAEFARVQEPFDSLALLPDHPNLLILRTFSKAYGLAGLRVGYGIAHPALIARIRSHELPYGIGTVAGAAVDASLLAHADLLQRVETSVAERDRLYGELRQLGLSVPRSHANFLWLESDGRLDAYTAAFAEADIQVRLYPGHGIRVTVGEQAANEAVLRALRAARQRPLRADRVAADARGVR